MTTPIDLPIKPANIKLSVGAHARAKAIAQRNGLLLQDVISSALLYMDEGEIVRICREQVARTQQIPKAIRGVLANAHRMTDAERKEVIDALS